MSKDDLIRKSAMESWISCPKRYELQFLKKVPSHSTVGMKVGRIFHKLAKDFFFVLDYVRLKKEFSNLKDPLLMVKLKDFFRESMLKPPKIVHPMMENFYEFEAMQWMRVVGTYLDPIYYFKPVATEREMHVPSVGMRGTVDRIDRYSTNDLVVVEYKTSNRSIERKESKWGTFYQNVKRELAFYSIMVNASRLFDKPVTYIALYNPKLNESFCERLSNGLVNATKRRKKQLETARVIGEYPRREGVQCGWCNVLNACIEEKNNV